MLTLFVPVAVRLQTEGFEIHAKELQVAAAGVPDLLREYLKLDSVLGWMDGRIAGIPAR